MPIIAGYDVERELGRGGMGVVYLARQTRLKRQVALKVIRGAGTCNELERFRAEAEAAAAVQHANIVQIFEVGEHDGMPYIALEYVDGGSLSARLNRQPLPVDQAATLIETLARAIHHAHQKGIVHRDLKPANVLLTSDGVPKVTDFGLAKRTDETNDGLTKTGAVMGTPAYMAPEQAEGHAREAGPAADVYALGAMLYEFLTGRPPFLGESMLEVIQKVLHDDPMSPSRMASGIPRDLETICLKCLAKAPAQRYASALGLAQDVERFRSGEPILGRREWVGRKLWRKARKRLVVLAASILVAAAALVAVWATRDSGAVRQVAALSREFEDGLAVVEWPAGHRERLEQLADGLAVVDHAQGEAARRKLNDRVADRVRDTLREPRVSPDVVPVLEAEIAWLAERDPVKAAQVAANLRERLRILQPKVNLPPHTNLAEVFPVDAVEVRSEGMRRKKPKGRIVPTLVSSQGQIRVLAEFEGKWDEGHEIGIYFHAPPNEVAEGAAPGYGFVVVPVLPRTDADPGVVQGPAQRLDPTFRESHGRAEVRLTRNGSILSRTPTTLPLPKGASEKIRVTAERERDRLRVQVNDLPAISFTDVVPLVGDERSVVATAWPASASLSRLRIDETLAPPKASPLEIADALYDRGRFSEALEKYQEQARAGGATAVEARCKSGLCLASLERTEEAAAEFLIAMNASGDDRWSLVAVAHLWLIRLKAKQFAETEALFASMEIRFKAEQLLQYVPVAVREELAQAERLPPLNFLILDPKVLDQLKAVERLRTLLHLPSIDTLRLATALALNRQYDQAAAVLDEVYKKTPGRPDGPFPEESQGLFWHNRLECWVLRSAGKKDQALETARRRVSDFVDAPRIDPAAANAARLTYNSLRIDLARCHAALLQWNEAENQVDLFIKEQHSDDRPDPYFYNVHAQAYLLKGFLAERRGDAAAARSAWARATYKGFLEQLPPSRRAGAEPVPLGFWGPLHHWIAASLSDSLTDVDLQRMMSNLLVAVSADPLLGQVAESVKLSPDMLQGVWRSPRGREAARKIVFLEAEPANYFRMVPVAVGYERVRRDLFEGVLSAEQDELAWQAATSVIDLACDRKLSKAQALQIALAWKGLSGLLGWSGVAGSIPAEFRGPGSYLFGLRYLKLNKPDEAKACFKMASGLAPAGSPLAKLSAAELAKMEKKK